MEPFYALYCPANDELLSLDEEECRQAVHDDQCPNCGEVGVILVVVTEAKD